MSQASSQYAAFWRDVRRQRRVWTIKDDGGFAAPKTRTGQRAMPLWSTLSRVQRIIKTAPAYSGFGPHEMSREEFRDDWLPELAADDMLIGVNWSGPRAAGYEISPADIKRAGEAVFEDPGSDRSEGPANG